MVSILKSSLLMRLDLLDSASTATVAAEV